MKQTIEVDFSEDSWRAIGCNPDGITVEFYNGNKLKIGWELARSISRQVKE